MTTIEIIKEEVPARKAEISAAVLADLPEWFGLPDATKEYVERAKDAHFWYATCDNGIVGFVYLNQTAKKVAEIYCIGVKKDYHGQKIGQQLVRALETYAANDCHCSFLQVKTVAYGKYAEYDRTVSFYHSQGFTEFEVFPTLWGSENPCQIMIKGI
ncbi:GNAT family N-acetyltransferase [Vagococcus sp. BWB3-3]|uniref:GNAT family N-acetyltransferase n=1 Tax=Vagococcus allomyrinae TaxID=2794353 RepID=A0A940SW39_9ENTE|nr:GNAT family N-acetyltransferase [Vagococcus allomyrinae]MBP1042930.1 GNAT family N-acetyltransferase [Vagococcus allomyrinae]